MARGVLGLGLGDEGGDAGAGVGVVGGDGQAAALFDLGAGALEAGVDRREQLAGDAGEDVDVADHEGGDAEAPRGGLGGDVVAEQVGELVVGAEDLVELAVAEDGCGGAGDQVGQGLLPVVDGEADTDGVVDAELEPEVERDGGAAGVVDGDAVEAAAVAAAVDVAQLDPREDAARVEVQAGAVERADVLAEAGDEHGGVLLDLDAEGAEHQVQQGEGEGAEGEAGEQRGVRGHAWSLRWRVRDVVRDAATWLARGVMRGL
jgi:hypothetical protein